MRFQSRLAGLFYFFQSCGSWPIRWGRMVSIPSCGIVVFLRVKSEVTRGNSTRGVSIPSCGIVLFLRSYAVREICHRFHRHRRVSIPSCGIVLFLRAGTISVYNDKGWFQSRLAGLFYFFGDETYTKCMPKPVSIPSCGIVLFLRSPSPWGS